MIDDADRHQLGEIVFVLAGRSKPTLVVISTGSYRKRNELRSEIDRLLPEYRSALLDLSGQSITSLFRTVRERAPEEVLSSKPVEYLLHIYGLEDSLLISKEGRIGSSLLIQELNLERENLFHEFPCCLIIWTTSHFTEKLKKQAPDLWDWITYSYRFEGSEVMTVSHEAFRLPELRAGLTDERKRRIMELEERLNDMPLKGDTTERVARSKLAVYKALGEEYEAAFSFEESIRYYSAALAVIGATDLGETARAEAFFFLGRVNVKRRCINQALGYLNEAREIFERSDNYDYIGPIYHLIGMIYAQQKNWSVALENYQLSLMWGEKAGMDYQLCVTWHQIGRLYEDQRNWPKAIDNYNKALECNKKTGMVHQLGGTWHQIGKVYGEQCQWNKALKCYHKALKWNEKTGMIHELSSTWQNIGFVYATQRDWPKALENYNKAHECNKKTGMVHALGKTFHQIGRVYEEMDNVPDALEYFQKALSCFIKEKWDEEQGIATKSIQRIFARIGQEQRERLKLTFPEEVYRLFETKGKVEKEPPDNKKMNA
ncbi:MAG: tetratricopeptide repeat protein [Desulfobacteraceae bacterium]|jgi:tetratricopeptide (TPR) repeat protein